jgi:hypothetical protein
MGMKHAEGASRAADTYSALPGWNPDGMVEEPVI